MTSDLFICPDCERPTATASDSLCASCQQWRESKFAAMDEEYRDRQDRFRRLRMRPEDWFAEGLADTVKVIERSGR